MARFRKLPVEIDAVQWDGKSIESMNHYMDGALVVADQWNQMVADGYTPYADQAALVAAVIALADAYRKAVG